MADPRVDWSTTVVSNGAVILIADLGHLSCQLECQRIKAFRRANPDVPVVALCSKLAGTASLLLRWKRAGLTDALFVEGSEFEQDVRSVINKYADTLPEVEDIIRKTRAGPFTCAVARVVLTRHPVPTTVEAVAVALELSRRTLYDRLQSEGIRRPKMVIAWTMLLRLIGFLQRGQTFERAALESGYDSVTTARRQLRSYADMSVDEARQYEAYDLLNKRVFSSLK